MQASESMDIVDKLTAIDLKAATSAGDIAEGLAQFANIGSLAGVDMDQAAAYVATIADVTQASGTQVGTSMKTIISRYGNVKAGAYNKMNLASAEEGDAVNDVEKVLNKIGISIRESSLTFKDFDEVLAEVAEKWDALDNVSKKAIATALAGIRQQESVVTLLSNWDKYEELLEVSRNSKGTAETKYTAYEESYQAAQKRLTAAIENVASNSGLAGLLTEGINFLAIISEALPTIVKWLPSVVAGISDIRALRGQSWLQKGIRGLEEKGRLRNFRSFFVGDKGRDAADAYVAAGGQRFVRSKPEVDAEKTAEANTVAAAQQTEWAMRKAAQQGQRIVAQGQAVVAAGKQEKQLKDQVVAAGKQEKEDKQNGAAGGAAKGKWASTGALVATVAINQLMAGMMAFLSGGQTHSDARRNTVSSSEQARNASRSINAVFSTMIPFIGGMIGDLAGDAVAKSIDKVRDDIHNLSADAQERTNVLQHISSQISKIKDLSMLTSIDDMRQANDLADEFLSEIYKSENNATREVFKEELRKINDGNDDLYSLVSAFKHETSEGRREAARKLEIAQVKALHREEKIARNENTFNQEEKLGKAQLKYNAAQNGFNSLGISNSEMAAGVGAGVATTGGLATVGGALMFGGGPILKTLGALLVIGSLFAGHLGATSYIEQAQKERSEQWENSLVSDKISLLADKTEQLKKIIESGNEAERTEAQKQLAATEEMSQALKDYQQYIWTLRDEDNKMLVEEALLTTQAVGSGTMKYLTDLNIVELKRLGVGNIYRALAEEVEKSGGLAGYSMKYDNGELTEGFLKYAERVLKTDEEIAAVISGESYKLVEALEKLNLNDQFDRPILQSFAAAVGTSVENLPQFITKVGELTLGDLLKSTQELIDATGGFSSMLNTMASSTESISGWMNKIVSQYPDLIAYMSDTPRVMEAMMEKLRQFNNQELKEQWEQYAASEDYYRTVFSPGIRSYIADLREKGETNFTDTQVVNALSNSNAQTMAGLLKFLMGQDTSEGSLYGLILEAFQHASGDTLVADLYREQLKNATEFIANAYQKQVDALTEQRDMLENINKQREYELKLLKARVKLEEAMNDKRRIYRAGVGWVYEADQNKIAEAQKEVEDLSVEKQISKINKQISAIAYIAEKWKTLWDVRAEEQKEELTKIFFGEFTAGGEGAVQAIIDGFSESFNMPTDGGGSVSSLLSEAVRLLGGIKEPVDAMSEQIVKAKEKDKEDTLENLEKAWIKYTQIASNKNATASELNSALENYQKIYKTAEERGYIGDNFHRAGEWGIHSTSAKDVAIMDALTPKYVYEFNDETGRGLQYYGDESPVSRKSGSSILEDKGNVFFKGGGASQSLSDILEERYGEDLEQYQNGEGSLEDLAAYLKQNNAEDMLIQVNGRGVLYHDGTFTSLAYNDEKPGGYSSGKARWGAELPASTYLKNLPKGSETQAIAALIEGHKIKEFNNLFGTNFSSYQDVIEVFRQYLYEDLLATEGKIFAEKKWGKGTVTEGELLKEFYFLESVGGLGAFYDYMLGQSSLANFSESLINKNNSAISRKAAGTKSFLGSGVLVNEFGTEAIITPSGTLTALPAHSGILPADITTNLWALGEIAPNLLRAVEGGISLRNGVSGSAPLCDESFNINNLTMNVSADSSFDADAFVKSIKARVALTKNLT